MIYTKLGKTGLGASQIGVGGWQIGSKSWGWGTNTWTAVEYGINFIDTGSELCSLEWTCMALGIH
jgi:aryl-alcohol dehydrogenase-like predicted oxidoreductase